MREAEAEAARRKERLPECCLVFQMNMRGSLMRSLTLQAKGWYEPYELNPLTQGSPGPQNFLRWKELQQSGELEGNDKLIVDSIVGTIGNFNVVPGHVVVWIVVSCLNLLF